MKACFKKCRTASVVNYRDKCKVFTLQHKIKHKNKQQTKQQQQNIKTKTKTKKPPKTPNKPERRKGTYLIPQISNKMSRFKNIASTGSTDNSFTCQKCMLNKGDFPLCEIKVMTFIIHCVSPCLSPNTKVTYQCQCFGLLFKLLFYTVFLGSYYVSLRSEFRVVMSITISA